MGSPWQRPRLLVVSILSFLLFIGVACLANAQAPTFTSPDGTESFKLGILGQFQADALENGTATSDEDNLFFRRLRLLGLVKVGDSLSVFFDTDSPNLGKQLATGKNNATIFMQDFVVTYTFSHAFMVDGGLILTPNDYNHLTSAGALLGIDYGAYTFNESAPIGSVTGRDYGAQLRGYLFDDHIEYRLGAFQGIRGAEANNSFRTAGRLAVYFWGAETGLFYRGTSLGKTATFEVGGGFDMQRSYKAYSGDLFLDQPMANGDGITLQGDFQTLNGGTFVSLLKQQDTLLELGYYIHAMNLMPFAQYMRENFSDAKADDEHRLGLGLGYYFAGTTSNLKFEYYKIDHEAEPSRNEFTLQYQIFVW